MKINFSYNSANFILIIERCNQSWFYKYSGIELSSQCEKFDLENISLNRIR